MKKLLVILGVICFFALGSGVFSYVRATPQMCSYVSGASVTGECTYNGGKKVFKVVLRNNSGSRCSASYKVLGKSGGSWEIISEGILTANDGSSAVDWVNMEGYENARLTDISTWKCN